MIVVDRRVWRALEDDTGSVLETLVVPACFLGSALIGRRLGTPPRVVGGLAHRHQREARFQLFPDNLQPRHQRKTGQPARFVVALDL